MVWRNAKPRWRLGLMRGWRGRTTTSTVPSLEGILDVLGSAAEDRRLPGPHHGRTTLVYVLILTTVTSYGAANTQLVAQFSNYHDCVRFAVAWTDSGRSPDSTVQWHCERMER
jgi:hypothetical protein